MDCQQLLKAINEYIDGEIDPQMCREFEEHLGECRPCQVVVDTIRRTITLYRGEQAYELPVRFRRKLHEVLRQRWAEKAGPSVGGGADAPPTADKPSPGGGPGNGK